MHILFLTDNFPPEVNAPATRTFEHASEWVKKGCKVTVVTTAPNFPLGKVFDGYKNSFISKEMINGIHVIRVKSYITANEGFLKRTLDYMSFMFSSVIAGIWVKKCDMVIATSPQFFTAVSGWALGKLKRIPFIFELRDIWPASIEAVGAVKHKRIIALLERLELFLYRQSKAIITVTHAFKTELVTRGISADKIFTVLNGANLSQYQPCPKDAKLEIEYGLEGKFVVGYVGTHGMAHALERIIEAAEILKKNTDIHFLFAGHGANFEFIRNLVTDKALTNVTMLGQKPKALMPSIWSLCDVSLVHLKDSALFQTVIPSKIFESMAMAKPIVISMPKGEACDIVSNNNCGVVLPPESPQALAQCIEKLSKSEQEILLYSQQARHAANKYDRKVLANDMLSILKQTSGI